MKFTVTNVSGTVTLFVAIVAAIITIENRFALTEELEAVERDARVARHEMRIDIIQDKLEGLILIPAGTRQPWQQSEILRLNSLIEKYTRKIGEYYEDE